MAFLALKFVSTPSPSWMAELWNPQLSSRGSHEGWWSRSFVWFITRYFTWISQSSSSFQGGEKPLHLTSTQRQKEMLSVLSLRPVSILLSFLCKVSQNEKAWGSREPKRVFPAPTHAVILPPWANHPSSEMWAPDESIHSRRSRLTVSAQIHRDLHRDTPCSSQPEERRPRDSLSLWILDWSSDAAINHGINHCEKLKCSNYY